MRPGPRLISQVRTVRFLKIRVKSDKLHYQNLVSFGNLVSPDTEGHRRPGDSWISHQCLLSTWLELWPLTTVFSGPIKRVWLSLHNVWKRKKKKRRVFFFFTHQQAVVFRFQMPLPAHRKHCPCVSHHSMKSPLPSGGRMKPSGKSCSQLFPATPSPLRALQSASHVPPPTPCRIPHYQKQQALSSRALQPLDTRLYTSEGAALFY